MEFQLNYLNLKRWSFESAALNMPILLILLVKFWKRPHEWNIRRHDSHGSHYLWRLAPTSIIETVSRMLNGSLLVSSGPSFWFHKGFFLPPLRFWLFAYNLEKWCWRIYLQGSSGETDIENRLMDLERREERMSCMERVTWKLTSPYVKQIANGNLLYGSRSSNRASV